MSCPIPLSELDASWLNGMGALRQTIKCLLRKDTNTAYSTIEENGKDSLVCHSQYVEMDQSFDPEIELSCISSLVVKT